MMWRRSGKEKRAAGGSTSIAISLFFLAFFISSAGDVALADPPKDATPAAGAEHALPPVPSDPQATSATYGDWVLVCQRQVVGAEQVCEISQSIQVQGQPGPIAQLAVSKPKGDQSLTLIAVLPVNILLTETPRASVDEKDPDVVTLTWQRCLPGGCFAGATLKDTVLAKWRAQAKRGRVEFKDGAGRALAVPFSYRGLGQALDALAKQLG